MKKPIAITLGDAAGIGPEIIAKAFRDAPELTRGCFVVGDLASMRRAVQWISAGRVAQPVGLIESAAEALDMPPNCLPLLQVGSLAKPVLPGRLSAEAGRLAGDCVVWAAQAALRGEVAALVTAPLNKEALALAGARGLLDGQDCCAPAVFVGRQYLASSTDAQNNKMRCGGPSAQPRIFFVAKFR